jgi:hypothetical protein
VVVQHQLYKGAPNHGSSHEDGNNLGNDDFNSNGENGGVILKPKENNRPIHGVGQTSIKVVELLFVAKLMGSMFTKINITIDD